MYTSETRFPLADATLSISADRIERMRNQLEGHGARCEPQGKDIYRVLFPVGPVSMELAFTDPQQHRIFFPDGFSVIIIDPPREEEKSQENQ
jgi:hypothetical protein